MYYKGTGVQQDYSKAFEWYQKAASQGDAKSQYNLGMMYKKGEGVSQDDQKTKGFFGKSCDNNQQKACDIYRILQEN